MSIFEEVSVEETASYREFEEQEEAMKAEEFRKWELEIIKRSLDKPSEEKLTDCCGAYSTYMDDGQNGSVLCCKACYEPIGMVAS